MATTAQITTEVHHYPNHPLRWVRRIPLYLIVLFFGMVTAFPVYWMVVSAIQPVNYSLQYPPPLFPQGVDLKPFMDLFNSVYETDRVNVWVGNSVVLASMTTVICLVLTLLGAFALSGMRWRGQGLFGLLLLMTQMLPEALVVIPIYATYARLNLKNNLFTLALVDVAFVLPICIWILKNVFDTIPREIRDAALVDGCSRMGVLWRVMVPISAPGLVAVGVVAFFHAWNEYLFALSLINDKKLIPASVGLASLRSMIDTPIDRLLAAGLLFSIFPIFFYLIVQRYVVAGLSAGAVKG